MPGLCAIVSQRDTLSMDALLDAMSHELKQQSWYQVDRTVDTNDGIALTRVHLGIFNQAPQPYRSPDGNQLVMLDGELLDIATLGEHATNDPCQPSPDAHAEIFWQGYQKGGEKFLQSLCGAFTALLWDRQAQQLTIINDRFGMRPLYYVHLEGKLLIASRIRSLLADRSVSRAADVRGISQFFRFGHYYGNDTSLAGIQVVPPGVVMTYDAREDTLTQRRYWPAASNSTDGDIHNNRDDVLDAIDRAFTTALKRCTTGVSHLGLSLSGGLDSRTILSGIDSGATSLTTVCYGIPGCFDQDSATELARQAGCQHINFPLDGSYLQKFGDYLSEMVQLTDGQYISQCLILPTLPILRERNVQVLLRGHGGELMHLRRAYNYSVDHTMPKEKNLDQLEDWIFARLGSHLRPGKNRNILRGEYGDAFEQHARESLHEQLRQAAELYESSHARIAYLFLTQRLRRETGLSMQKFNTVVQPRLPYLDPDLIALLLKHAELICDPSWLQSELIGRRRPEFLRVANANTGARIDAGPLTAAWAKIKQRGYAKLGVTRYQPYERLGLWLRRELSPLVKSILLSDECLDQGIYDPQVVRAVVEEHIEQRQNHTYLLLALMIFELGRRNLESSPVTSAVSSQQP